MLHLKVCILQTCNRKEYNVFKCVGFFFLGKFATESEALTKNVNVCI